MIKISQEDLEWVKNLVPKNSLTVGTSTYNGWKSVLGFLAVYFANKLQLLSKPLYNNQKKYIAHAFILFQKDNILHCAEMVSKENWQVVLFENSNTCKKMKKGEMRIFIIKRNFSQKIFNAFFKDSENRLYSIRQAIGSFRTFRFFNYLVSKKDYFQNRFCSTIITRFKPFHKYLKIDSYDNFIIKNNSSHPEALDSHLLNNGFTLKILKVKKNKFVR